MIKVGVVIPFYGGSFYLPRLLQSIFAIEEDMDIQVYIIDNSRNQERLDEKYIVQQKISVIQAPIGIGYGKACNIGFQKCLEENMEIAVIVNQDGYFEGNALGKMVALLKSNDSYTVAMPLITQYDSLTVESFFTHVYLTPMQDLTSDLFQGKVKDFYTINLLCGACFALKIKDYSFPYLFDQLFYMYYEDVDLGRRLRQNGQSLMFIPGAIFHHQHSNTDPQKQKFRDLLVKRVSRHAYLLKDHNINFFRNMANWCVLEFRNVLQYFFQLNLNTLSIEMVSIVKTLFQLQKIVQSRSTDKQIFNSKQ